MGKRALLLILLATSLLGACQKVSPNLLVIGSGKIEDEAVTPDVFNPNGRVTLGSQDQVLSSGNYKLKARLTAVESLSLTSGDYKLRSTVRF